MKVKELYQKYTGYVCVGVIGFALGFGLGALTDKVGGESYDSKAGIEYKVEHELDLPDSLKSRPAEEVAEDMGKIVDGFADLYHMWNSPIQAEPSNEPKESP